MLVLFTFIFLNDIFGAFLFSFKPHILFNFWVFLFGLLYFVFWFASFYWLSRLGIIGVFLHSLLMTAISISKIIFPLHPFILLYPQFNTFLPETDYGILNLFLLFFFVGVFFCNIQLKLKGLVLVSFFLVCFFHHNSATVINNTNTRLAIVQVGLYYEKGGNTSDFFRDLLSFLKKNTDIDAVVFSENNLYSYKKEHNQKLTEELIDNIISSKIHEKYHLFLSFSGFKDINNVVTYYHHKSKVLFNQKKTLIPFIEKKGLLNNKESMQSNYFHIDSNLDNHFFDVKDSLISTFICYDALFPGFAKKKSDMILIQSNYKLLDNGYGHDRLKIYATYLAKFINGLKSNIIVNIQNHGGTVILFNDWSVDHDTYMTSLSEPFFIIDTKNSSMVIQ
ncbi:hypothetical protein OGY83_18095 [Citrobacter sp. Cpo090]|uniref:hypothetical protein n=1 Tax=Citrobacter sp. Cpo090 TaxID=2985139 RepID=UPI002574DC7C|nr:hypothetical protein [Citrobacter sp. Cpo090]MDM2845532.1 hypothetical protein [Citrobacter sp. Cpo090]